MIPLPFVAFGMIAVLFGLFALLPEFEGFTDK
jgi:hypothetical protein